MAEMSPGTALRELQHAQSALRKARALLRAARTDPDASPRAFAAGWRSLQLAHAVMASLPATAAREDVLTKHLAVSRYATALLVRLRRLRRGESGPIEDDDGALEDEE